MRPPGKIDYVYSGSGILERTVRSGQTFVLACVERHLLSLPSSVRLVVMLSSSEDYIDACRDLFDGEWVDPDAGHKNAYRVKGIPFVHVPHPSGQAAGFRAVFNGKRGATDKERGIPECRRQALAVVAAGDCQIRPGALVQPAARRLVSELGRDPGAGRADSGASIQRSHNKDRWR
jgi:hypothetical protein